MDEEHRWPRKGDNPFLAGTIDLSSSTWAALHWLASREVDDSFFALAFKEAGDKIVKELNRGEDRERGEKFFLPIAYLYRHCLELKMKTIIRQGIRLQLIEKNKKISDVLRTHNLSQLWNALKKVVQAYWPEGPQEELQAAEQIVEKFHAVDKSGQNLRYGRDKSGESTLHKLPESVELTHLQEVLEAIFNFLDGCQAGLEYEIDMRSEMLSYDHDDT